MPVVRDLRTKGLWSVERIRQINVDGMAHRDIQ